MANPDAARGTRYERALLAVGRRAEEQRLRDICVLEVEGGMLLQGQALITTRDGYQLVSKTQVLSHEDLEKLARQV